MVQKIWKKVTTHSWKKLQTADGQTNTGQWFYKTLPRTGVVEGGLGILDIDTQLNSSTEREEALEQPIILNPQH